MNEYRQKGKVERHKPAEVRSVSVERQRDRERAKRSQQIAAPPIAAPPIAAPPIVNPTKPADTIAARPLSSVAQPIEQRNAASPARQPRLALTDDLVDAPSIGPKTAKRFAAIGITTVEQFLNESPEQMETSLRTSWITATKIGRMAIASESGLRDPESVWLQISVIDRRRLSHTGDAGRQIACRTSQRYREIRRHHGRPQDSAKQQDADPGRHPRVDHRRQTTVANKAIRLTLRRTGLPTSHYPHLLSRYCFAITGLPQ